MLDFLWYAFGTPLVVMIALRAAHDNVSTSIPPLGYWTLVTLMIGLYALVEACAAIVGHELRAHPVKVVLESGISTEDQPPAAPRRTTLLKGRQA